MSKKTTDLRNLNIDRVIIRARNLPITKARDFLLSQLPDLTDRDAEDLYFNRVNYNPGDTYITLIPRRNMQ